MPRSREKRQRLLKARGQREAVRRPQQQGRRQTDAGGLNLSDSSGVREKEIDLRTTEGTELTRFHGLLHMRDKEEGGRNCICRFPAWIVGYMAGVLH